MKRLIILALATTLSAAALSQTWKSSYQAGLDAVHDGEWADARQDFQVAESMKPGDTFKGIVESRSPFHATYWRGGAPYSPLFLSAYSGLKEAMLLSGPSRSYLLSQVAAEFESLISKGQYSVEVFFFLDETYVLLSETDKRMALGQQFNDIGPAMIWKVDKAGIEPDDKALIAQLPLPSAANLKSARTTAKITPASYTTSSTAKPDPILKSQPMPVAPVIQQAPNPVSVPPTAKPQSNGPTMISAPSAGDKAAGPTASLPDASPALTPDPKDGVPSVGETTIEPNSKAIAQVHPNQTPVVPSDQVEHATSTTQPVTPTISTKKEKADKKNRNNPAKDSADATAQQDAATAQTSQQAPAPKPKGRHKGKQTTGDDATPLAFTGVAPIEVKKIEHPTTLKTANTTFAVPTIDTKYALIIGNSHSKMDGGEMSFAGDDAQLMRQSLVQSAGYLDQNIELVIDATSAQIAATVNALASRVADKGTVFIYFSGVGANIDGKDYLAGVDTDVSNDSSTMIPKDDIYKAFMLKGARIYAFYQCNRPIVDGHFFGSEIPQVGCISQMEATLPGQSVYGINTGGKLVGLFTNGFADTLRDIRSNQTPILDFGWQLFYNLRRGDTGQEGGSSNQSPSLPVLTNMASDARF